MRRYSLDLFLPNTRMSLRINLGQAFQAGQHQCQGVLRNTSGVNTGIHIHRDSGFLDCFQIQHFGAHARSLNHFQLFTCQKNTLIYRQTTADQKVFSVNSLIQKTLIIKGLQCFNTEPLWNYAFQYLPRDSRITGGMQYLWHKATILQTILNS